MELFPDPLTDDQTLIIDSEEGLILILGCAHAGLINILHWIQKQLPGRRIHTIIGGTHLGLQAMNSLMQRWMPCTVLISSALPPATVRDLIEAQTWPGNLAASSALLRWAPEYISPDYVRNPRISKSILQQLQFHPHNSPHSFN